MTHTFMYVILPKDTPRELGAIQQEVDRLMAPYSEEIESSQISRWDWYSIGGRWNGILTNNPQKDPTESMRSSTEVSIMDIVNAHQKWLDETFEGNVCLAQDIVLQKWGYPEDILTPDGEWHADGHANERAQGVARNASAAELLTHYKDHMVVGVDYHV